MTDRNSNDLLVRPKLPRTSRKILLELQACGANYSELHKWCDVIIFSTQGGRSLASLLAEGGRSFHRLLLCLSTHFLSSDFHEGQFSSTLAFNLYLPVYRYRHVFCSKLLVDPLKMGHSANHSRIYIPRFSIGRWRQLLNLHIGSLNLHHQHFNMSYRKCPRSLG
jgi:hypothetical protein